ncbi:hypothetical protein, partial [Methylobacterium sp. WL8]|uniref:hypothetical protein n=1 Tax=Methylobacterium sp. WL8 TaxID=2603899 RepID=UPI00164EEBEA
IDQDHLYLKKMGCVFKDQIETGEKLFSSLKAVELSINKSMSGYIKIEDLLTPIEEIRYGLAELSNRGLSSIVVKESTSGDAMALLSLANAFGYIPSYFLPCNTYVRTKKLSFFSRKRVNLSDFDLILSSGLLSLEWYASKAGINACIDVFLDHYFS